MALKLVLFSIIQLFFFQYAGGSQTFRLGTKTAYHFNNSASSITHPDRCEPIHLNMVIRHGSRLPSDGDMEEIDALLTKLNQIYTKDSPFRYQNLTLPWIKPPLWNDGNPGELTAVGEIEQYSIAKRFRARFNRVFDKKYWNKYYSFVSSDKPRTTQSAMAFAHGLFESQGPVSPSKFQPVAVMLSGRQNQDKLLSSYKTCPRYEIDVDENGLDEVEKFLKGPEARSVTERLEKRLKITGKMSLTFDLVEKLFRLCAFGVMNRNDSSWCDLLEDNDVKIMEYQGDLEAYYEHSYGNQLNLKMECTLLSEITKNLRDFSAGQTDLRGVFRFTSSGTLVGLLTILGLFKDSMPLRADNYLQMRKRQFVLSNMVPMSGNVAVVLYACKSSGMAEKRDHKVQVLVNEEPVTLPCCHENVICSLDEFLSCFKETVDSCDLEAMCSLPSTDQPKAMATLLYPRQILLSFFLVFTLFIRL